MKEIKAYVHRNRIAEVLDALKSSGLCQFDGQKGGRNITVYEVKGSLAPIAHDEERYSLELAETVVHEFKLELICEDELTDEIVETIRAAAQTGQTTAGWICVVDLERVVPIRTV